MKYFYSVTDDHGFIHSIDMLTLIYNFHHQIGSDLSKLIKVFQDLAKKFNTGSEYFERLNVNPCSSYQYYQHHIHLCDGIYLSIGRYTDILTSQRGKHDFIVYPLVKLKINPNKHFDKPICQELLRWLKEESSGMELNKYDYAIDIPLPPKDIEVFGSRKEKGLSHGTRYYGQKNKNGYCKIYDKAKEQKLDTPLTRVEHTISTSKTTKNISFEKIYYRTGNEKENIKLSDTNLCIVKMAMQLKANDLDYEDCLKILDWRKRKIITEALMQGTYNRLDFDKTILDKLLDKVKEEFGIPEINNPIYVDDDGFMHLSEDDKLPFY